MANYTNLTSPLIPEIENVIGTGFGELFGDPMILGILGLFVILGIGFTLKVEIDTLVLSGITMLFIIAGVLLPEWLFWLTLLPIGIYAGIIFSRITHK